MNDRSHLLSGERLLAAGFVALAAMCLAGLLALLFDRTAGGARRAGRRAAGPPAPGRVPASRHAQIETVAPR